MKTQFLFPNHFKIIGWLLFVPALISGIFLRIFEYQFDNHLSIKIFALISKELFSKVNYFSIIENGILDEIILIFIIVGGILVGFSKLKIEDELISKIRYESLVWATYFNFGMILFSTIFIYGIYFIDFLIANIFSLLLFFIVRFHFVIYKFQKSNKNEE